ncbi:MAG TPA: hypothetical protein VNJ70_17795 [Thermoanaerobaculia bacterium]|nr:hypothetical protein [Thermoanaerobaculia bacterium]
MSEELDPQPPRARRPGRPKGKPLSEKEQAQRRTAALKTGKYAATATSQVLPACKPSNCLVDQGSGGADDEGEDPVKGWRKCEIKKAVEDRGGGLAHCLVTLGRDDVRVKYLAAIRDGDLSGLQELAAMALAAGYVITEAELETLARFGLTDEEPIVGKVGDTAEIIGYRTVERPGAALALKLMEQLGLTGRQQVITPMARGEKAASDALDQIGQFAWITAMRRGLGAPKDQG